MDSFKKIRLLGRGCSSECFLVQNPQGEEFVWKKPTGGVKLITWLRNCRREACITEHLSQNGYNIAKVQVSYHKKRWTITSKLVTGKPLDPQTLKSLPPKEKKQLIQSFATFLFDLHNLPINRTHEHFSVPRVYNLKAFSEKLFAYKRTYLPTHSKHSNIFRHKRFLKKKAKIYQETEFSPKYIQMTEDILNFIGKNSHVFKEHGVCYIDFHSGNIFYDSDKKILGILDFGACSYSASIYRDFALIYISSFGKKFTRDLIHTYNRLCKESNLKRKINFDMVEYFAVTVLFEKLSENKKLKERYLKKLSKIHEELKKNNNI